MKTLLFISCIWAAMMGTAPARSGPGAPSAQHRRLRGVVTDAVTHTPIANLAVSGPYLGSAITNNQGEYTLSLDASSAGPGDYIELHTYNAVYGASEQRLVLSKNGIFDFSVDKHPTTIYAYGLVKDAHTGNGLAGIEVTALVDAGGTAAATVRTDGFGRFRLELNRLQIRNEHYIRILLRDPSNHYAMGTQTGMPVDINSMISLELNPRPAPSVELLVNSFRSTHIRVTRGAKVTISAKGNMELGKIVGTSGPDGREAGFWGGSLADYSFVRSFNHGALMYRISGDGSWELAGKYTRFVVPHDGFMEFQINDRQQYDNSGAYSVTVTVAN